VNRGNPEVIDRRLQLMAQLRNTDLLLTADSPHSGQGGRPPPIEDEPVLPRPRTSSSRVWC
jgi:hypothetical protein